MAFKIPAIKSVFQAVRRRRADSRRPDEPIKSFPESHSNAFLSFWPQLCPMASRDARMVRNVAPGSKLCQLRRLLIRKKAKWLLGKQLQQLVPGLRVDGGCEHIAPVVPLVVALDRVSL